MKSVNYGKSAQDLSLGTYSLGNEMGEGRGGRVSLSKDINFLVSQHKAYKKHRNSSMESVSRLY